MAGFFSGNEIHEACQAKHTPIIAGYVAGVYDKAKSDYIAFGRFYLDAMNLKEAPKNNAKEAENLEKASAAIMDYCPPEDITLGQIGDIFCKFIAANPTKRHQGAPALFNEALSKVWPCKK